MADFNYFYLNWAKSFIDILEFASNSFDADTIFEYFAKKVVEFTKCDKVVHRVYEKKNAAERYFTYVKNNEIKQEHYRKITSKVLSNKIPVGELSIYYYLSTPAENILDILSILSGTLGLIVGHFNERVELQESQMRTIIAALASDYGNITYVDVINGTDTIIKANTTGILVQDDQEKVDYADRLKHYVDEFIIPEEKEEMRNALSIPTGIERTKNGELYNVSCRIMIDGKIHYRNIKFVPQMEDGKLASMVIGYHSTDSEHLYQEKLEGALTKAEVANNAKTAFLFNMSHDIRTPMNAIIGLTALAKKHIDERDKVKEYLDKISTAGDQLLGLINKVLEMSRIESGNISLNNKEFDVVEKIHTNLIVFNELCVQKGLKLNFITSNITHKTIISDPERIDQIINNLLGNATKYTFEGGNVSLTISQSDGTKPDTCLNTFVVEDTGIGMSKEFVEHIFDEFSRETSSTISRIEGTGLGMSIVKRVVNLLGGDIKVESEKGVGTKITFTLETPFCDDSDVHNEKYEKSNISLNGLKVLLAEDNALNREITTEILVENNMKVTCAFDGIEAVEAIKSAKDGDFDVILMDIQMPNMDGYEATREIRKLPLGKDIPIIALSANAFEEDKQKSFAEGMNDHVAKPIDIKALMLALAKIIH